MDWVFRHEVKVGRIYLLGVDFLFVCFVGLFQKERKWMDWDVIGFFLRKAMLIRLLVFCAWRYLQGW